MNKVEILAVYQKFFDNMNGHLNESRKFINKEKLDFSVEEIRSMGLAYRNYTIQNKLIGDWGDPIFEAFVAYYGEAWRHNFGGAWKIAIDTRSYDYGYPQIIEWGPPNYPWVAISPKTWARIMEKDEEGDLSMPYKRKINFFTHSKEWADKFKEFMKTTK